MIFFKLENFSNQEYILLFDTLCVRTIALIPIPSLKAVNIKTIRVVGVCSPKEMLPYASEKQALQSLQPNKVRTPCAFVS